MPSAIVIGAGHNGLVAATVLARAGWSVHAVERRSEVGGLAAGGTFGDGHAHHGVLPDTAHLAPQVVSALGLQRYGLTWQEAPPLWVDARHRSSQGRARL